MDIYNYHRQTFEYTHTTQASESPREPGVYLIPAFSTTISPPTVGPSEIAIFNKDTESWTVDSDHRGKYIYNKNDPFHIEVVDEIGEVDTNFTLIVPNYPDYSSWNGTDWDVDINAVKLAQCTETKRIAKNKIVAIVPEWKQRNRLARTSELLRKEQKGTITQAETDELDTMENEWNSTIKPIRDASDLIEAEINGLLTVEDILAYDVESNPLWP